MAAIFVERLIRVDIDRVWELTQNPELHQRWDLRFSEIKYLPREPSSPQRFLYRTHIGFGMPIEGEGESVGERDDEKGTRTSALKFWSSDSRSLIREGSGYWQYEPKDGSTVFRTRYDYKVRYGVLGKLLDFVFRPIIGTATAWSFDAMGIWAERGIDPESSVMRMRIHGISRVTLAAIWLWQGTVPKLLFSEYGELAMTRSITGELAVRVTQAAGIIEILIGIALLYFWRARWLLLAQGILPIVLPLALISNKAEWFAAPFNPVSLAIGMAGLGLCGYLAAKDMPSAANCKRKPDK